MNTINTIVGSFSILTAFAAGANELASSVEVPKTYRTFVEQNQTPALSETMKQRLLDIEAVMKGPEYKALTKDMQTRVDQALSAKVPGFLPRNENQDEQAAVLSNAAVLFVSESIPLDVLRTYAKDLAKVRGVMVFRGLKGGLGKLGPMVAFIGTITREDIDCKGPSCRNLAVNVLIDPQLFKDNGITAVPALAFLPEMQTGSYCSRGDDGPLLNRSGDVVYGDASLVGMLRAMNSIRKDTRLESLINILDGVPS